MRIELFAFDGGNRKKLKRHGKLWPSVLIMSETLFLAFMKPANHHIFGEGIPRAAMQCGNAPVLEGDR